MVTADGVIEDYRTGLDWVIGPDQDTILESAIQWVTDCQVAGGGWRMPTREELQTLYQKGVGERNMHPAFETTGWWIWAKPEVNSNGFFLGDEEDWNTRGSNGPRAFGVRTRPQRGMGEVEVTQ